MVVAKRQRSCRACDHKERSLLDALLKQGFSPRAIARRIGNVTRLDLNRHRDRCLLEQAEEEEAG